MALLDDPERVKNPRAVLIEIVEQARLSWPGQLQRMGSDYMFFADSKQLHMPLAVPRAAAGGASEKDKVAVRPVIQGRQIQGRVERVLGAAGKHETEMHAILLMHEFTTDFSKEILDEVAQLPANLEPQVLKERRDFRDQICFTIDPVTAQDFDDAISWRQLDDGCYEIGVHIADVSHYVAEGSLVDKEACRRGTSVYLVDRCVPMLPERLSNDLCSLCPKEDRLAFSVVFEIDKQAQIRKQWMGRSVIRSRHRYTYDEAYELLKQPKGDDPQREALVVLDNLAQQMREQRFAGGAMRLHSPEYEFQLDKQGHPIKVSPRVHHRAHELIEEWMLLANRQVAEYVYKKGKEQRPKRPFVYRVHEAPDPDKVETFFLYASRMGFAKEAKTSSAQAINKLLKTLEGNPVEPLFQLLAIRCMAKACYTTQSASHFGLAFSHYTHFTSPIRRYPDLMAHRLLQEYLSNEYQQQPPDYEAICIQASACERRAIEAERDSIKYKQAEYLQDHIGKHFSGIVSHVTRWGFYVVMDPHGCEGLVPVTSMKDDYYVYDPASLSLSGERNGAQISLGQRVEVKVLSTNPLQREVMLAYMSKGGKGFAKKKKKEKDLSMP